MTSSSSTAMRRRQDRATQSPYITKFRPRGEQPAVATPSPKLRETVRKACLDNARRKRRDLVQRKRLQVSNRETHDESNSYCEFQEEEIRPTRMVVEEELRKFGVGVQMGCFDEESSSTTTRGRTRLFENSSERLTEHPMESAVIASNDTMEEETPLDFYISEEDLFEILEEVEDELARLDEDMVAEQVLEAERDDQLYLQRQIEDFEEWEEFKATTTPLHDNDDEVLCPVCQTTTLMLMMETKDHRRLIGCPEESCPCRLDTGTMMTERPLPFLREALRQVLEDHAKTCNCVLRFEAWPLDDMGEIITLVACCDSCGSMVPVV